MCLFVRVEKGESLLAMDAGGVSDPFATARWGALECTTEIKYETVDPVWDETFVFELGSIGEVVDEDLTLCLYDYDLALNDFLGFVRVDLRGKKVADAKDWSRRASGTPWRRSPKGTARASRAAPGSTGGGSRTSSCSGRASAEGRARQDRRVGGHARRRSDARGVSPERSAPRNGSRGRHVLRRAVDRSAARAREPGAGHFGDGRQQRRPRRERPVLRGCVGAREDAEARDGADALRRRRGRAPEWDRKFSFVISRPYTQNTLWFKVYDYDGGFDQFIGQVKLKCEDLEIHRGLVKPPAAKWYTLYDAAEKDRNAEGEPYGEILLAAWSTRSTWSTCTTSPRARCV